MTQPTLSMPPKTANKDPWDQVAFVPALHPWFDPPPVTLVMQDIADAIDSGGRELIAEVERDQ